MRLVRACWPSGARTCLFGIFHRRRFFTVRNVLRCSIRPTAIDRHTLAEFSAHGIEYRVDRIPDDHEETTGEQQSDRIFTVSGDNE